MLKLKEKVKTNILLAITLGHFHGKQRNFQPKHQKRLMVLHGIGCSVTLTHHNLQKSDRPSSWSTTKAGNFQIIIICKLTFTLPAIKTKT